MKPSCNQLHHLTNTIPSPFARLNKHPDLLQASNHLKSPGTWHIFAERTFKEQPPGNKGEKKTYLVCPDSFQSNKHDKLQDYHLQMLRFIKRFNGSHKANHLNKHHQIPRDAPPKLQQHDIWGFRGFWTTQSSTEASLFTHRHITIVTSASMQQNHFWASNCMGSSC